MFLTMANDQQLSALDSYNNKSVYKNKQLLTLANVTHSTL